ncbi:SDR family NAD(P)-dependent oxidoreductase [Rhodococcus gordoniae]
MSSILLTGATNGLGLALAEELVEAGPQLLLRDRNPQQPVPIAQCFRAEQYIAELSAPAKTQRLAAEVAARHQQRLAVNHPSPVLLIRQLLPLLRAGSPSHGTDIASVVQEPMKSQRSISIWSGP